MPVLNNTDLDQVTLPNSHYGYSATRLEDLGATEYTIATIVCDVSGSTAAFTFDMESAINKIVQACKFSPRADNLLLRLVAFDDNLSELHGFKLLENCNLVDYGGVLRSGGSTALYDAAENAIASTINYGQKLAGGDFSANAIFFVLTDGMDNASKLPARSVKDALARAARARSDRCLASKSLCSSSPILRWWTSGPRNRKRKTRECERASISWLVSLKELTSPSRLVAVMNRSRYC